MDEHTMRRFAKAGERVVGLGTYANRHDPRLQQPPPAEEATEASTTMLAGGGARLVEPPLPEQLRREAGRMRMHAQGLESLADWLEVYHDSMPPTARLGILVLLQRARG